MTYEEAKKVIAKPHFQFGRCQGKTLFFEALGKAVEAIEKQIPKKPYLDNENGIYETEHCPFCHRRLFPNDHHCRCGQAIDWSEVENT